MRKFTMDDIRDLIACTDAEIDYEDERNISIFTGFNEGITFEFDEEGYFTGFVN